jgi:hypothetical protein
MFWAQVFRIKTNLQQKNLCQVMTVLLAIVDFLNLYLHQRINRDLITMWYLPSVESHQTSQPDGRWRQDWHLDAGVQQSKYLFVP